MSNNGALSKIKGRMGNGGALAKVGNGAFPKIRGARDRAKEEFNKVKPGDFSPDDIHEILFDYKHTNLRNALYADVLDVIPIVGDIANAVRVSKLREDLGLFEKGQERRRKRLEDALESGSIVQTVKIVRESVDEAIDEARRFKKQRGGMQVVDAGAGFIPELGVIADVFTPTNTINYLQNRGE